MLPRGARLHESADFRRVTRSGVRSGRPTLVVHAARGAGSSRVGFVVSKAVGNAVVRNRVKRRLRHLVATELAGSPDGLDVVVRALPASATSPARLDGDLASAWGQAQHRLSPGSARVSP